MKSLSIGNEDFKVIRDSNCYYVDKTTMIGEILDNAGTRVFLFTRPRRFGKTLNMSMIDAFFNIEYQGNNWFKGLKIERDPRFESERNRYPVIRISFKDLDVESIDGFTRDIKNMLRHVYDDYGYLEDSDKLTNLMKREYCEVLENDFEPAYALKNLTKMLERHHGTKTIVLIDEYDNPLQNTYGSNDLTKIIPLMRRIMSSTLKGNDSLKFGIVTGVMQIAKESLFSGLNNLNVNNVLSERFDEHFGFTSEEVLNLLEECGHPEKYEICREWYDGYRFGKKEIYNPLSVLDFIYHNYKADSYWAGTSGNDIIHILVENADSDMIDNLKKLGSGESIISTLDSKITYFDMNGKGDALYSVLVMAGYLKAEECEGQYSLSIPNKEIYEVFFDAIPFDDNGEVKTLIISFARAVTNGDTEQMTSILWDLIIRALSAKILDTEHAYQTFIIGLLMAFCGQYRIFGDRLESGLGFADIIMEKKRAFDINVVMELKRCKDESDLESESALALKQIEEKEYHYDLKGRTILYGISFCGKEPRILSKVMDL